MAEWFFPELSGGEEQGLNDAGVDMFKKDDSLARETCQNIGDVWDRDSGNPAIATFELIDLPIEEFPGAEQLLSCIESCKNFVEQQHPNGTGNENKFFEQAIGLLKSKTIPTLRIGDENTSGLFGLDDERTKPFFRLLRGQGTSTLQGDGGGTYGIGQRAPFARSALRTVFYSTKSDDGCAFIGKSILASFPHPDTKIMTQNKGWWCNVKEGKRDWTTVRDPNQIPSRFLREIKGTDIWVTGFMEENWETLIKNSVLKHFFAAIYNNQLTVIIKKNGRVLDAIDSLNIEDMLIDAVNKAREVETKDEVRKGIGATLYFYKALSSPVNNAPFRRDIADLGEVKIYVYQDKNNEDIPERWAYLRKPRILVESGGSKLLKRFAAVVVVDSDAGNTYLSALEGAEHNRWHPEETRQWTTKEKNKAKKVLSELARFLRDTLKEIRGDTGEKTQDIPFLGRYLPADESDDEYGQGASELTGRLSDIESGEKGTKPTEDVVRGSALKNNYVADSASEESADSGSDENGKSGLGDRTHSGGKGDRGGSGDGNSSGGGSASIGDIKLRSYRYGNGYRLVILSENDFNGKMQITGIGEKGTFPIELVQARDEGNNYQYELDNGCICDVTILKNCKKIIYVEIDSKLNLTLGLGAK